MELVDVPILISDLMEPVVMMVTFALYPIVVSQEVANLEHQGCVMITTNALMIVVQIMLASLSNIIELAMTETPVHKTICVKLVFVQEFLLFVTMEILVPQITVQVEIVSLSLTPILVMMETPVQRMISARMVFAQELP